jgi:hypothetical protein
VQAYVPFRTLIPLNSILLGLVADRVCLCEYNKLSGIDVIPKVVVDVTDRLAALTFVSVD